MNFFGKHYEKLLLGVLLLLFILLLFVLSGSSGHVAEEDLILREMHQVDHEAVDFTRPEFDVTDRFADANKVWMPKYADDGFVIDLTLPMVLSRCPYCNWLLPQEYFSDHDCPLARCGRLLPTPANPWKRQRSDVEKIDPRELYDEDFDGFSYRYEILCDTDPLDPKDHPPLWERLYVYKIARQEIGNGLRLTAVNSVPERLQVSYAVFTLPGKEDPETVFYGDTIEIDDRTFTLAELSGNTIEIAEGEDAQTANSNATATLVCKSATPDGTDYEIKMHIDTPAYYPEQRVFLKDIGSREEWQVDIGDTVTMGNNNIGQRHYRVAARDTDEETITIFEVRGNGTTLDGKEFVIGKHPAVPASMQVSEEDIDYLESQGGFYDDAGWMTDPGMFY